MDDDEIKEILDLSEEELLFQIGLVVEAEGLCENPSDKMGLIVRSDDYAPPSRTERAFSSARAFLAGINDQIQDAVCRDEEFRDFVENKSDEHMKLTCLLREIISGKFQSERVTALIAALLVKRGIMKYCADIWK